MEEKRDLLQKIDFKINKIYDMFDYLSISKSDYYDLIEKEIMNLKEVSNITILDLEKKVYMILFSQVRKLLINSDTTINIINKFIDKRFSQNDTYKSAISNFKLLSDFFHNFKFEPSVDIFIELLDKNPKFLKNFHQILNKYDYEFEKIKSENKIINEIKDAYIILNNVSIDIDDNDIDNYINDDLTDNLDIYFNDISKKKLLSKEEELELARRIKSGDELAKKKFIESNLRLVPAICKKFIGHGLSYLDLIQEGNMGLLTAVERFDPEMGYKFSTYATIWIKQSIQRALVTKARNIRIPVLMHEKLINYRKAYNSLEAKLNRTPSNEEIALETNIPLETIEKIQKYESDTWSLNNIVEGTELELEYFIPSDDISIEEKIVQSSDQEYILKIIYSCGLRKKEIDVLSLRYGFNGNNPKTLEEIAKMYAVTSERIRQIELRAFRKILSSSYMEELANLTKYPEKAIRYAEEFNEEHGRIYNKYY